MTDGDEHRPKQHVIVGGDGMVGSALRHVLERRCVDWIGSTRRPSFIGWSPCFVLDLECPILGDELPDAQVVYLVAANPRIIECEKQPAETWVVNADAPVVIARHYWSKGTFVVFVSSDAVESCGALAYARQKAYAETFMQMIGAAIVRPARIAPERAENFAEFVAEIGQHRAGGVFRWR